MKSETQAVRRRSWLLPILLLVGGVGLSSCYEDYGLSTQDYDTYFTHYAAGTNFQKYRYFVMPDTIVHIYDRTAGSDPLSGARKYDHEILSLTASNLEARGYIRKQRSEITTTTDDSTLVCLIGQMTIEHTGYYYDYWWGYWGWYWPGYYPPYYPPSYGGTYEYSTGTNITELIDLGQSVAQNKPTPVWSGLVSGLTGSSGSAQSRLSFGINRQFEQSPYLYSGQ
jgi:hypothetical protein